MLLLAAVGAIRCAVSTLCPTDSDILEAMRVRDAAVADRLTVQAVVSDDFVTYAAQPVIRIANVLCGEPIADDSHRIACKFTARYRSRDAHTVAYLVRQGERWTIADSMTVTRPIATRARSAPSPRAAPAPSRR